MTSAIELFLSSSIWCSRNGRPATSTSAFGIFSVKGRNRVARPPARMTTGREDIQLGVLSFGFRQRKRNLQVLREARELRAAKVGAFAYDRGLRASLSLTIESQPS